MIYETRFLSPGSVAALALALALPATASGQEIGFWVLTESMSRPRVAHTATLLRDGTVLVAGGHDIFGEPTATVELYDPRTRTWDRAESMNLPRSHATATLLQSGEVLVVGGGRAADCGEAETAELYNPSTDTWTFTGTLREPRASHSAALLPDGNVLVVGGWGCPNGLGDNTTEVYDPVTRSWSDAGTMTEGRVGPAMVTLRTGQVLVAGGTNCCGYRGVSSADLYDPETDIWQPTDSMSVGRSSLMATLLSDGQVLAAGGSDGIQPNLCPVASAELYDPIRGVWTLTESMDQDRASFAMALLADGRVLVAGGETACFGFTDTVTSAEVYDPDVGTWRTAASMNVARRQAEGTFATLLSDGSVLVTGGAVDCCDITATAELYFPGERSMAVASIDPFYEQSGRLYRVGTGITIEDIADAPVAGATVTFDTRFPDETVISVQGVTDADGVVIKSGLTPTEGLYTFTVTDVRKAGYEYTPAQNEETSDSEIVPTVIHVDRVESAYEPRDDRFLVRCGVAVQDEMHEPTAGVSVRIVVTTPGDSHFAMKGTTDERGIASVAFFTKTEGTYSFRVVKLIREPWIYDPLQNEETSDSVTIP